MKPRWAVLYVFNTDPNGQGRWRRFQYKKDAEAFFANLLTEHLSNLKYRCLIPWPPCDFKESGKL